MQTGGVVDEGTVTCYEVPLDGGGQLRPPYLSHFIKTHKEDCRNAPEMAKQREKCVWGVS